MFLKERRSQILEILKIKGRVTVNELSVIFSVSKETIRSDLSYLAVKGLLERSHGGALIIRRIFRKEIVNESNSMVGELLEKISKSVKKPRLKEYKMKGNVCILGSFNVDIVAKVDRFPRSGESIMAIDSFIGPGGKGTNQAIAASHADAKVHFVAKVGNDQFSQLAYDYLSSSKIDTFTLYKSEKESTGNALIYVTQDSGENMIAIHSGANVSITESEVADIEPYLLLSDVLLIQLENNINAIYFAIKLANALNIKIILNPAPYSDAALPLLPFIQIITPNETEASQLSGIEVTDIASAKLAAKAIHDLGVSVVIITMGSNGALIFDGNHYTHIAAFPAVPVDTTGAGDAFNGALAASIAKGKDIIESANYASMFASLAVEKEGASSMPENAAVIKRLSLKRNMLRG